MTRSRRLRIVEYAAYALAGIVAFVTITATGVLPDGMQDVVANAVDNVGVDLPGGDERPAAPRPEKARVREPSDSGRAFPDTSKARAPGAERRRYVERDAEADYYGDYYRQYYGLEEEEEEDDGVYYVPADEAEHDGYNPGQPGEPGGRAVREGGGDAPGESDGTPGEPGPPGDPG